MLDSLSEYEDDELWKCIHSLYGPLLQISLVFPSFRPSHRTVTLMLFVAYSSIFLSHFLLLLDSAIRVRNDISMLSQLLHYLMLLSFGIFSLVFFNIPYIRKTSAANQRTLSSDIGTYQHGRIYEEDTPKKIAQDLRKETLMYMIVPGFIGVGATMMFFFPYYYNFNSSTPYTESGINRNLPIAAYYPFDTDCGVGHYVALGAQISAASGLSVVVVALAFLFLRVTFRLRFEFKVLKYALDTLFERASLINKKQKQSGSDVYVHVREPCMQKCIGICLTECIIHHHKIIKLIQGYAIVTRWPAAGAFVIGCLGLGPSLFCVSLAISEGNHEKTIIFAMMIIGEIIVLLMLCVLGESITTGSLELRDTLYNIGWYDIDLKNRRLLLNFQVGVSDPVIVKAGISTNICLDTFSRIINTAYSFFNLMNANME